MLDMTTLVLISKLKAVLAEAEFMDSDQGEAFAPLEDALDDLRTFLIEESGADLGYDKMLALILEKGSKVK